MPKAIDIRVVQGIIKHGGGDEKRHEIIPVGGHGDPDLRSYEGLPQLFRVTQSRVFKIVCSEQHKSDDSMSQKRYDRVVDIMKESFDSLQNLHHTFKFYYLGKCANVSGRAISSKASAPKNGKNVSGEDVFRVKVSWMDGEEKFRVKALLRFVERLTSEPAFADNILIPDYENVASMMQECIAHGTAAQEQNFDVRGRVPMDVD